MTAVTVLATGCAANLDDVRKAGGTDKPNLKRMVFIGDSITGGWGFETDNYPIAGNLISLKTCAQDPPPSDVCTNNEPGAANRSVDKGVPPWIAYPYQVQSMIKTQPDALPISNYAVSGATPAMWDPYATNDIANGNYDGKYYDKVSYGCNTNPSDMSLINIQDSKWNGCDPNVFPGLYATTNNISFGSWNLNQLPNDRSTLTVFTLGANPIMSRYLGLSLIIAGGIRGADVQVAHDAANSGNFAELDASIDRNIFGFRVVEHLTNLLMYLADRGPVIIQKLYESCPGMLGNTDSSDSGLTTDYATCKPAAMKEVAHRAVMKINAAIDQAVSNAQQQRPDGQYTAICPGYTGSGTCDVTGGFRDHPQFENTREYGGSFPANNPWVLSNDTGIHPNAAGHRYLASGIVQAACREYNYFCGAMDGAGTITSQQWWPIQDKSCRATYYCAFAAIRNETNEIWRLDSMTSDSADPTWSSEAGEWVLLPPNEVKPGETMRYAIQSRHASLTVGAKGRATYKIGGQNEFVHIATEVGFWSNDWELSTTNDYLFAPQIDNNNSKNQGSEEIMNGTVRLK